MRFSFPLYKDDGVASVQGLSVQQFEAIARVKSRMDLDEYRLVPVQCLCRNQDVESDWLVSEKDRYGFAVRTLLCRRCGLVRSERIFDSESIIRFYRDDYRAVYSGGEGSPEEVFLDQQKRGQVMCDLFHRQVVSPMGFVFEIGCAAGGVLSKFKGKGCRVAGCDFQDDYLAYGRSLGLSVECAEYGSVLEAESVDVMIVSHVMEHFADPVGELVRVLGKVRPGGYLVVEVPGIFRIHSVYFNPLSYLQNAHVFSFSRAHLDVFFKSLGLTILYGSEKCLFILQKPLDWQPSTGDSVYDSRLARVPERVRRYIWGNHVLYALRIHPFFWAAKVMDLVGARPAIARILNRFC